MARHTTNASVRICVSSTAIVKHFEAAQITLPPHIIKSQLALGKPTPYHGMSLYPVKKDICSLCAPRNSRTCASCPTRAPFAPRFQPQYFPKFGEYVHSRMRLLRLKSNDVFELITLIHMTSPPYAILSHTQTKGEEVTYDELVPELRKTRLATPKSTSVRLNEKGEFITRR